MRGFSEGILLEVNLELNYAYGPFHIESKHAFIAAL